MSSEMINVLFTLEGLSILAIFMIGYGNSDWWLSGAFYFLLPLSLIAFIVSFFSLFSKGPQPHRKQLKRFVWFNFIILILLTGFVLWATGTIFPA